MITALFDFSQDYPYLLRGLWVTSQVVMGGLLVALIMAFAAGLSVQGGPGLLRALARLYIEFFRGSSALIQIYWAFFVLPLVGVKLPAIAVGIGALGLNIGAYGAEVVRSSVQSVAPGQIEAGRALGLNRVQILSRLILPQAIPSMMPPFGNLAIELLKASALIFFLSLQDIFFYAKLLRDQNPGDTMVIYMKLMLLFGLAALVLTGLHRLLASALGRKVLAGIISQILTLGQLICRLFMQPLKAISETGERHIKRVLQALLGLLLLTPLVLLGRAMLLRWSLPFTFEVVLPELLSVVHVTLLATLMASVIALLLGLVWAGAGYARVPLLSRAIQWCTIFLRSTPILAQLFLVYFGVLALIDIQLPLLLVGSVILGVHYSTYTAEVYRSGIEATGKGQFEAAKTLGISRWQTFRAIVLPQAVRRTIAPLGNYIIAMFKETPLLATITVGELMRQAISLSSEHFREMEAYTLVGVFFLIMSYAAAAMVRLAERIWPVRHA